MCRIVIRGAPNARAREGSTSPGALLCSDSHPSNPSRIECAASGNAQRGTNRPKSQSMLNAGSSGGVQGRGGGGVD